MITKNVIIQIPLEIYEVLQFYNLEKELEKEIKLLLAIDLFKKGYLTLEQASKLAGISIADFIEELNKRNIPILEYSEEELKKEIENAGSIK